MVLYLSSSNGVARSITYSKEEQTFKLSFTVHIAIVNLFIYYFFVILPHTMKLQAE